MEQKKQLILWVSTIAEETFGNELRKLNENVEFKIHENIEK
jgi:hypothetical protein